MKALHGKILTMPVAITRYDDVIFWIVSTARQNVGKYVCVANVHMCMEAFDSPKFNIVVNKADLVVPDGMPLVWSLKMLGGKLATQVRGADLVLHLCAAAEENNIPIGLYGGNSEALFGFVNFLVARYPALKIVYSCSPPFREPTESEKSCYVDEIIQTGVRILFVGLGCPKQEKWMFEHRDKLSCVMIGVGAAFDFFGGLKKQAPRWMQRIGLEWIYRFASDPRRLWKRYMKHNPRFLFYFSWQLLRQRFCRPGLKDG